MQLKEHVRNFSEVTTIHGVRYIGEKERHWAER
jgi:hypothetical protein